MKYYQIFYNSSQSGLSGKAGFGVRTATEGTPSEYISLLNEEIYRSYKTGAFAISNPSQVLMETPERIFEYPVRYYYRHFSQPGKKPAYTIARIVSAGFDHSYYMTGQLTRPGNYIAHLFLFEEAPKKDVFDLLYEQPQAGANRFLPVDYSPRLDNKEMTSLMLGTPTPLPIEAKPFTSSCKEIPQQSFDLFFSYLEALKRNVSLVVKTKAVDAAKICGGLFRLLPSSIAKDATFEINHQASGTALGTNITFINEYYQYPVASTLCEFVDFTGAGHQPTTMEQVYRADMENIVHSDDLNELEKFATWVYAPSGEKYASKPKEFIIALYNYCCEPESFSLKSINTIDGLLLSIKEWIGTSDEKAQTILTLMKKEFDKATTIQDFKAAIQLAEKIEKSGIGISSVKEHSKTVFTPFLVSQIGNISSGLLTVGSNLLNKYADLTKLPKLDAVIEGILKLSTDQDQKKNVLTLIESDPAKRLQTYIRSLHINPESYPKLKEFMTWDESAVGEIDYLEELKEHLTNPTFAPLFLKSSLQKFKLSGDYKKWLPFFKAFSQTNPEYGKLLQNQGAEAYTIAYGTFVRDIANKESLFDKGATFIKENVLDVITNYFPIKKDWQRLYDVLKLNLPTKEFNLYYQTAKKIGYDEAMNLVLQNCLPCFEEQDEITEVTNRLLDKKIYKDGKQLIEAVRRDKNIERDHRRYFLTAVAIHDNYDLDTIESLVKERDFGNINTEPAIEGYLKKHFPKLHAERMRNKKSRWFKEHKKNLFIGGSITVVLIVALLFTFLLYQNDWKLKGVFDKIGPCQQDTTMLDTSSTPQQTTNSDPVTTVDVANANKNNDTATATKP